MRELVKAHCLKKLQDFTLGGKLFVLCKAFRENKPSPHWGTARIQAGGTFVYQFAGAAVYQAPHKFPQFCWVGTQSLLVSHLVLDCLSFKK